jgi:hypothetical protein
MNMRVSALVAAMGVLSLSACTSVATLDTALQKPAAAAKSASEVAALSEQDVLKSIAIGAAVYDGELDLANIICYPAIGPDVVVSNLATFSDSLAAVDAVGAKPKDASLAAALARIRDDDKSGAKDYEAERTVAVKQRDRERARCTAVFGSDSDASTHLLVPPAGGGGGAALAASATFAALDSLAASLAGAVEELKRDEAVKATVRHLLPGLQAAVSSLQAPRTSGFGVQVIYATPESAAETMNRTTLGAAISLRRWWVAKAIKARWTELSPCRSSRLARRCIDDAHMQSIADDLSAAVLQYRALALIDADKVIASLQTGVSDAQKAVDAKTSKDLMDSLSEMGSAVGSIDKSYQAYAKSRT